MTSTKFRLPPSLPYPITFLSTSINPGQTVKRGTALLTYSFDFLIKQPELKKERRIGTWESTVDGIVESWLIKPGSKFTRQDAEKSPVVTILEECAHPVQISGMCAVCGKDTTITDYIGSSDEYRASIRMTHDATGPTVSLEEATRIERETSKRLLNARKLSLIVDLDQTIIHATVDPTVGEWIAGGQLYEQRKAEREAKALQRAEKQKQKETQKTLKKAKLNSIVEESDESSDGSSSDSDSDEEGDEEEGNVNPNWDALKDVSKFKLGPDGPPMSNGSGTDVLLGDGGCDYYIKPRPGLQTFLDRLKEKYEMHVYTMGTRAYALKVCSVIDPTGDLFNQRILSRDESGSMTQKSIQRLFPTDNSMVVVIDDRADVWQYSPNLVKVIPYDFFVGIGDINASFLPKSPDLLAGNAPAAAPIPTPEPSSSSTPESLAGSPLTASPTPPSTEPSITKKEAESVLAAQAQSKAVEAQLEQRPLAKMQEALEAKVNDGTAGSSSSSPNGSNGDAGPSPEQDTKSKALLKNDDQELERVWQILGDIHKRFFERYDANAKAGTQWKNEPSRSGLSNKPDVKTIIPAMKAEVLSGLHLLFSGVIPLKTNPARSEAWKYAKEFGAKCHTELTDIVTHIIAAQAGTSKAEMGLRKPNIKVMKARWFQDCIALWKRLPETDEYLLDPERAVKLQNRESAPSPKSAANGSGVELQDAPDTPKAVGFDLEDEPPDDGDIGTPGGMDLDYDPDNVDWADVDREVDEFLNESDEGEEEDDEGNGEGDQVEMADAEDERMDGYPGVSTESVPPSPRLGALKLKRRRSSTPSGSNSLFGSDTEDERSPLAKRKKLTTERRGASGLKVELALDATEENDDSGLVEDRDLPNGEMSSVKDVASSGSEASDDDEESSSEESGNEGQSSGEDEEFLAGLADGDGWG